MRVQLREAAPQIDDFSVTNEGATVSWIVDNEPAQATTSPVTNAPPDDEE